jgi:hypothetical protein
VAGAGPASSGVTESSVLPDRQRSRIKTLWNVDMRIARSKPTDQFST